MTERKRFADMTDTERFETGGGYDFADEIAAGFDKCVTETIRARGHASTGVMLNTIDVAWLVEAYQRLRDETK